MQIDDDRDAAAGRPDAFGFLDDVFLEDFEAELQRVSSGRRGNGVLRRSQRSRLSRSERRLQPRVGISQFFTQLAADYDEWVSNPGQELLLGAAALLAGNFLAHYTDTTFGQSGFWETVVGAVATFVVERISREYFMTPARDRTATLKLLNALKVGFLFGLTLDALKLAG